MKRWVLFLVAGCVSTVLAMTAHRSILLDRAAYFAAVCGEVENAGGKPAQGTEAYVLWACGWPAPSTRVLSWLAEARQANAFSLPVSTSDAADERTLPPMSTWLPALGGITLVFALRTRLVGPSLLAAALYGSAVGLAILLGGYLHYDRSSGGFMVAPYPDWTSSLIAACTLALPPSASMIVQGVLRLRGTVRAGRGACMNCGYSSSAETCPECGLSAAKFQVPGSTSRSLFAICCAALLSLALLVYFVVPKWSLHPAARAYLERWTEMRVCNYHSQMNDYVVVP